MSTSAPVGSPAAGRSSAVRVTRALASATRPARARVGQRRQYRLDPVTQMLECRRQHEALAEMLERLVGREAGTERRDLEEDAARLAEVDGPKPEAVDDRRRPETRLC